jgi:hypothetical protein
MVVGVVTTFRTRMPGLLVASDAPVRFMPVIETLTEALASPVFGVKAVMVGAPTPPVLRMIDSRLPTASYVYVATWPYPSITCESRPRSS